MSDNLLGSLLSYGNTLRQRARGLLGDPVTYTREALNNALPSVDELGAQARKMGLLGEVPEEIDPRIMDAGLGLLGPVKAAKAGTSIADWKWRPAGKVAKEVGLTEVPDYIKSGYGAFMAEQAAKAKSGNLSPRDLIKAYTITRSSVNRTARNVSDDIASGNVRPEGYFSEWLLTKNGKQYLDDAEKGIVNKEAISDIAGRFSPFGMAGTLAKDMEFAASRLSSVDPKTLSSAATGSVGDWRTFAKELEGIGPAKAGFMASMLGRGDLPTLDARQLTLHAGGGGDASKFMRRGGGTGGDMAVDRLASRQKQMNLALDENLSPFYQHLTHHAIWDRVGKSQTTHEDLVRAMKHAAYGVPVLYGTGGLLGDE